MSVVAKVQSTRATLIDLLRWRADRYPNGIAFTFLNDGTQPGAQYTYAELDAAARSVAASLQEQCPPGSRALLLHPPGADYVTGLFGCLYAGLIAVPAAPPWPSKPPMRLRAIVKSAQPSIILTTRDMLDFTRRSLDVAEPGNDIRCSHTDGVEASAWSPRSLTSESVAILQYTSGSTAAPRGVTLTHANILHNSQVIQRKFNLNLDSVGVIWLPPYHDMGLIGGIIQPLYTGFPVHLFAPLSFLQRPIRWLEAISNYRGTCSGGPNFAYEICLRKIRPEQVEGLDLSTWTAAFVGAEPIHSETLDTFSTMFARCGFSKRNFIPCYGLAEATLLVTSAQSGEGPKTSTIARSALVQHRVGSASQANGESTVLVSCGSVADGHEIRIVNQDSLTPCEEGQVGEVWFAGPSVSQGYWHRSQDTQEVCQACLTNGEGPYLRSGDLGFLREGELYITGRSKDLIIIRGENHYPQDIEFTVEQSHPSLMPSSCAAFSVVRDGAERLVIVQEVDRRMRGTRADGILTSITRVLAEIHQLKADELLFVERGTIPRTSSGKIQRYLCRSAYLSGSLTDTE